MGNFGRFTTPAHPKQVIGWFSLFLSTFLLGSPMASGQPLLNSSDGETAAVLGFQATGLSASAAEALANVVRKAVLENGRLILIDRDRTEAVLAEQGYIMAGGCFDVSCMVEAGRVLGAKRVITGSINQLGRKYLIELRSANVATGRIEALETHEYTGSVEDMTTPVLTISKRLVARLINDPGIIVIATDPRACAVEVDGEPVGFAPVRLERPGGVEYRVTASRFGYQPRTSSVHLAEGDSVTIVLRLSKTQDKPRRYREPSLRLFASGGFPLNQASSNLDRKISWGTGQTYGGVVQFGSGWRLGFGGYEYYGEIDDLGSDLIAAHSIKGRPAAEARVIYSSLTAMLGDQSFAPFIGGGLGVMERTIIQNYADLTSAQYTTEFEAGWVLSLGIEIGITRFLAVQVEMLHARSMSNDSTWWRDQEAEPDPAWVTSFDAFQSFTIFRMNVGLKL